MSDMLIGVIKAVGKAIFILIKWFFPKDDGGEKDV